MAVEIKFWKGLASQYNEYYHGQGIYFATDTAEIMHENQSYGSKQLNLAGYATEQFVRDCQEGLIEGLSFDPENSTFSYLVRDSKGGTQEVTFSLLDTLSGTIKNLEYSENTGIWKFKEVTTDFGDIEHIVQIPTVSSTSPGYMTPELLKALSWNGEIS